MTDYKLMPVEPTAEMLEAYCGAQPSNIAVYLSDGVEPYKAMLAAAPVVQTNLAGHMGAFTQILASLAAAISLLERGGKKAAASDRMFEQMLNDYRAALEAGRNALSQQAEPVRSPRTKDTATILATGSQEPAPVQDEVQAVIRNLRCIAKTVLSSEARSSMRADLESAIRLLSTHPAQTAPQPEQSGIRAIHAMILNALDRDAAEGKEVRGEMAAELRAALSDQGTKP